MLGYLVALDKQDLLEAGDGTRLRMRNLIVKPLRDNYPHIRLLLNGGYETISVREKPRG